MKENKEIKKAYIAIIAVLLVGALLGGGTYAYFQWQSNTSQRTSVSFTISKPGFTIVGDNVTSNTLVPTQSCYYTNASYSQHTLTGKATVTATNNTALPMRATITLKGALKPVSGRVLPTSGSNSATNIHWAIKKVASATTGYSATNCTGTAGAEYATGTFAGITPNSSSLTYTDIPTSITFDVAAGQTITNNYQVYVWIDSDYTSINTGSEVTDPMQGLTVSLTFSETSLFTQDLFTQDLTLYGMIQSKATSTSINFSQHSGMSGTNGIYTTTATEGNVPVYYYRGKVNNNLIFNNMCWKIIRTTETGGVKLIYNGTPSSGQCTATTGSATQTAATKFNSSCNDNACVGYMYGTKGSSTYEATHANTNNSTIKTYIDNWFNTNFDDTAKGKLEDTVFCNDRSTVAGGNNNTRDSSYGTLGFGTNNTGYGTLARASDATTSPNPSLACPNANDKFTVSEAIGNGALTYPVGLITLDEAVLAGFNTYASNNGNYQDTNNYLYTGQDYWTLSPVHFYSDRYDDTASVGHVYFTGAVSYNVVAVTYGVRPVVSLAHGTQVQAGGEGTRTKPYVVE